MALAAGASFLRRTAKFTGSYNCKEMKMKQKILAAWLAWHRWALSKTGERIGLVLLIAIFLYFLTGVFSARAST